MLNNITTGVSTNSEIAWLWLTICKLQNTLNFGALKPCPEIKVGFTVNRLHETFQDIARSQELSS